MHLEQVSKCLLTHCFYVKLSKCLFCHESIAYLGHIVPSQGVNRDPGKIEGMVNWPQPNTMKQLKGFLSLTGYYRCFIANYASIAAPLTDLLHHESFSLTHTTAPAFTALKQATVGTPVLRLPYFLKSLSLRQMLQS